MRAELRNWKQAARAAKAELSFLQHVKSTGANRTARLTSSGIRYIMLKDDATLTRSATKQSLTCWIAPHIARCGHGSSANKLSHEYDG